MKVETLNCPNCGAAVSSESPSCQFCESRLATVACPQCFAAMFVGTKHCPRCGAAAVIASASEQPAKKCPRCHVDMPAVVLGTTPMNECPHCEGLWVDVASFAKICSDREQQSAVLGGAAPTPTHSAADSVSKVSYVPCPQCKQLMNRVNFAKCSGVIVDVCKGHGTWFDRDELSRIVEFIRDGGLEAARDKDRRELEGERDRLRLEQMKLDGRDSSILRASGEQRLTGIASAGALLKFLLE